MTAVLAALMMTGCSSPAAVAVSGVLDSVKAEIPFLNRTNETASLPQAAPGEKKETPAKPEDSWSEVQDIVDKKTGKHALADEEGNYHLNGYRLINEERSAMPDTAVVGAEPTVNVYSDAEPEEDVEGEVSVTKVTADGKVIEENGQETDEEFLDYVNRAVDDKKAGKTDGTGSSSEGESAPDIFKTNTVRTQTER